MKKERYIQSLILQVVIKKYELGFINKYELIKLVIACVIKEKDIIDY